MSDKNIIMHFLTRDINNKFSSGYVNFMSINFPEYEHYFFIGGHNKANLPEEKNIYRFLGMRELIFKTDFFKISRKSSKIIISGLFSDSKRVTLLLVLSGYAKKIYIQFWGGDFYAYRCLKDKKGWRYVKFALNKKLTHNLIKRCAGTINLIDGDSEQLAKVFPNDVKNFVAPMPGDPREKYDFEAIRREYTNKSSVLKILCGNSATATNYHVEAFHMLEHLKESNIEIICPLSYGDFEYRDKVIEAGKNIFGEKFIPVMEYVSTKNYIEFLASCDAAVFNCDRQQALGNISFLLRLGKKIYLRENTSMWEYFRSLKACIYSVSELENITPEELVKFPSEYAEHNIHIAEEIASGKIAVKQWHKIFQDTEGE